MARILYFKYNNLPIFRELPKMMINKHKKFECSAIYYKKVCVYRDSNPRKKLLFISGELDVVSSYRLWFSHDHHWKFYWHPSFSDNTRRVTLLNRIGSDATFSLRSLFFINTKLILLKIISTSTVLAWSVESRLWTLIIRFETWNYILF